jgi:hypothetical protein
MTGHKVEVQQRCRQGRERKRKRVEQNSADERSDKRVVTGHAGSGNDERALG